MTAAIVTLCPGQGAQTVGMARRWCESAPEARAVFDAADRLLGERLGARLSTLCWDGPAERLNQTDVGQPALYVAGVASWRAWLASRGLAPNDQPLAAAAGLSLGEYTALHLAGAFEFEAGLELVTLRGRAMQDAATAVHSGMVALIGADEPKAREVCEEARGADVLVCANFNAPGQIVLSGSSAACARALAVAQARGLRATPLAVAGAFHSPIMRPAADALAAALERTEVRAPSTAVLSNVTGTPHDGRDAASIRRLLVEQLTSAVRWAECGAWLAANHPAAPWHEVAPGRTLAGLMRRIDKNIKVESHDEPA
ncbi:MAG: ACP S-malonyltransferase [Phycisphaerae bacterium]|nr:ACP S-malonyltransferase [Phycisphaerae bacterium]